MADHFEQIDRLDLAGPATPLQEMSRLRAALESTGTPCPRLFVKREDLTQTAGGGNKIRKLEYLFADARAKGADVVVTAGALQSNHVRQTAGGAALLGFECIGVLFATVPNTSVPYTTSGNVLLDGLFGADIRLQPGDAKGGEVLDSIIKEVSDTGRMPYIIPVGGSNAIGCLGYVRVVRELKQQAEELGIRLDHLAVANGSTGTHAGLVAGTHLFMPETNVYGIGVLNPDADKVCHNTASLARATAALASSEEEPAALTAESIKLVSGFMGDGYGIPTPEMVAAVRIVARTEGLLLDPVYSGKAMAGLIGLIQSGTFSSDETVVFIATGGSPGLFAYADTFNDQYAE